MNLYFIKKPNGLFYYGIDYLQNITETTKKILVRPPLENLAKQYFPYDEIIPCDLKKMIFEVINASIRGVHIYTPTSHPIPFLSHQTIVLHDTYPFMNRKGVIKKYLFLISARSSKCTLAYINKSDGCAFYKRHGFKEDRLMFAPNMFPGAVTSYKSGESDNTNNRLVIGLVGTDSDKKNYHLLFNAARNLGLVESVTFLVYGQKTSYFTELTSTYTDFSIELIISERTSLSNFLAEIDALVSVSFHEGFGRPIAAALQSGIPCFLIRTPVFSEFFSRGAFFFDNELLLLKELIERWRGRALKRIDFRPPIPVIEGFGIAVKKLQTYG